MVNMKIGVWLSMDISKYEDCQQDRQRWCYFTVSTSHTWVSFVCAYEYTMPKGWTHIFKQWFNSIQEEI